MYWRVRRNDTLPVFLQILGYMLIQVSYPIQNTGLRSIGTWTIVLSCGIVLIEFFICGSKKSQLLQMICLLFCCAIIPMAAAFRFDYSTIVEVLAFLQLPLLLISYDFTAKNAKKAIYTSFVILSLLYIATSFTGIAHTYRSSYGVSTSEFLTLGFNNPNELSMYLLSCAIVLTSLLLNSQSKKVKAFVACDLAYIAVLIFRTQSRSGALCLILFAGLSLLLSKRGDLRPIKYVAIGGAFFYIFVEILFAALLKKVYLFGETVETGRFHLYMDIFRKLTFVKVLLGDISYQYANLHNGFLSIFASSGILGLVAFLAVILYTMKKVEKQEMSRSERVAYIGFCMIILCSAVEAAPITAGSAFAFSSAAVYYLSLQEGKVKNASSSD